MVVGLVVGVLGVTIWRNSKKCSYGILFTASTVFLWLIIQLISTATGNDLIYNKVTQYECVMEDGQDFTHILEDYDIVKTRGDIIVLQAKNRATVNPE